MCLMVTNPPLRLHLTACDVVDRASMCCTQVMVRAEHIFDWNFATAWAVRRKNVGEPVSLNQRYHQAGPRIGTVDGPIPAMPIHHT